MFISQINMLTAPPFGNSSTIYVPGRFPKGCEKQRAVGHTEELLQSFTQPDLDPFSVGHI